MVEVSKRVYLESLGCARNTVDSEVMMGRLQKEGWSIVDAPELADTIVVNTCSFIEPAIDESIDTILEFAKLKKEGSCRRLIVAGCLPQRFKREIIDTLPEVDVFIGTGAFARIVPAAEGKLDRTRCLLPDPEAAFDSQDALDRIERPRQTAYLKIAEGCSRHCTYCIIPSLRGKQRSRPVEALVEEARHLIESGVKELVLVAQDTTAYGSDLHPDLRLSGLLERLSPLSGTAWIRILYGHPESITDDFIEAVGRLPNVCPYFDIPIQHASEKILKRMGRRYSEDQLDRMFDRIRKRIPHAALRTTVITGFPGEKDEDCRRLLDFMEKIRFDHLGVFLYSDSEDLPSHRLSGKVSKRIARERYDLLMSRQREISLNNNRKHLHKRYTVLVDGMAEDTVAAVRTGFQAPEVDGMTYLSVSEPLSPGRFLDARIIDTLEYDLVGEPIWEN